MSDSARGQVSTAVVLIGLLAALALLPRTQSGQRSLLYGLVVGKDNRTSTSQCVALAWTFVVVYLLLSLLAAMWFGDGSGWTALQGQSIGPYLVFLGGPFAAGILAKVSAVKAAGTGTKTTSPDPASPSQLVTDDSGQTDLGDLQYVLFNAIAIAFVLVSFAGHLYEGLPTIPQVLWALALTSAGGYTAKKLITDPLPAAQSASGAAAPTAYPSADATLGPGAGLLARGARRPD